MRRKLLIIFTALCLVFVFISGYVIFSIENSTGSLDNLIKLHKIADMRDEMLHEIQIVQDDLHLKQTRYARDLAQLVAHVSNMSKAIDACFDCHHSEDVVDRLNSLHANAENYKKALSRVYTIRANAQRLMKEEDNAFMVGENLIREVEDMLAFTNRNLEIKTQKILKSVNRSKDLLFASIIFAPIVIIGMFLWFYRNFTKPISSLINATVHLKSGDLDYRIENLNDEFGEVAQSFNEMSSSLKEVMETMIRSEQMVLVGEMTSRLAHEIKNPITGIKLAVEIIREEAGLKGEFKDLCTKTIEQIKGMEKLMKGLLNFAKPLAPEFEMEDLNEIINTTCSTIEIIAEERSRETDNRALHLIRELDKDLPPILTDASQVQQILMNLMLNAVDAMPKGGTLTVRSSMVPEEGFLKVDIVDTGDGIDPQIAKKIFQPFYSTKNKGTGLGLAVVSQLVDLLGGNLCFKSEVAVGTTFTVYLPEKYSESDENK